MTRFVVLWLLAREPAKLRYLVLSFVSFVGVAALAYCGCPDLACAALAVGVASFVYA